MSYATASFQDLVAQIVGAFLLLMGLVVMGVVHIEFLEHTPPSLRELAVPSSSSRGSSSRSASLPASRFALDEEDTHAACCPFVACRMGFAF